MIGAFMTGLFSSLSANPGGANGAFYGNPVQMWYQIAGILTAIGIYLLFIKQIIFILFLNKGFASSCTILILLPLKYTIGIRLSPEEELRGLDWAGKIIYFTFFLK
jgi:Amt family ammonium transporter